MATTHATAIASRGVPDHVRVGLDAVRAVSALYVVAHHVAQQFEPDSTWALVFRFGQEAVIMFFLLSGFVIFANERDRVANPKGYFLRRARRIYPPLVGAMLVSLVLWRVGLIDTSPTLGSAAATLTGLVDIAALKPGVWSEPFLGNAPLWSLSYELAFYLLFPAIAVVWRRSQRNANLVVAVATVASFAFWLAVPNHAALLLSYFSIWWLGAMLANAYLNGRLSFASILPSFFPVSIIALMALVDTAVSGAESLGTYPVLMLRHFAVAAVASVLISLRAVRRPAVLMAGAAKRPVVAVAALSYGLYVCHYPILIQSGAAMAGALPLLAAGAATIAAAWIIDPWLGRRLPRAPVA